MSSDLQIYTGAVTDTVCSDVFRKAKETAIVHVSTEFLALFLTYSGTTPRSLMEKFPFSSTPRPGRKSDFFKVHVDEEDHMVVKSIC